ncbi:gamma-glutamylcyclotransferase [Candidatus Saccharibacteria bacterium]|nr:gamma-glutamylcyclotransferase [Candidatus Saccharibacteria bacterium]
MKLLLRRKRYGYLFGYGSDTEGDILKALTHRHPKCLGDAVLSGYELRVQFLDEVTDTRVHDILLKNWSETFRSYVIIPAEHSSVHGKLFKVRIDDRHLLDTWELVALGWYQKIFVEVSLLKNNRRFTAETQALAPGQTARGTVPDTEAAHPWLQPKSQFILNATRMPRK